MELHLSVVVLVVVVLCQTIPSGCFWSPVAVRLNKLVESIFANGNLKDYVDSAVAEVPRLKQFRQLNFNKNVYINKTTSHTTVTLSLVSTTVVSTSQFCARFVGNVAGGCRRRRRRDANQEMQLMLQPSKVNNRQESTQLAGMNESFPDQTDDPIQSSMSMTNNHDSPSGRILGSYYYFFYSPVYFYIVSTSTSYVYTTTKTFFLSLCVPSSFSYPIC